MVLNRRVIESDVWLLTLGECSVNILLLCLGVLLAPYRLAGAIPDGGSAEHPMAMLVNFAIAGGIWSIVFHAHLAALRPQRRLG